MSTKHPIISVVGSSGAGTSTVKDTFEKIFQRENVSAAMIEGDAFHRFNRNEMKSELKKRYAEGDQTFSHFSYDANLLETLEKTFKNYAETGNAETRTYVHNNVEAEIYGVEPGNFTEWRGLPDEVNIPKYADLKIGVVPVINLEWIQKIHRDTDARGYTTEAVTDTILRRMHAYVHCICPQFTETDINFQRVPVVDTSNPFIARWIPTADESLVVIRFRDPHGIDFPYLVSMIEGSWMSRANSIVIPGGKLDLAMQLILTPLIKRLVERSKKAS